MNMYKKSRFYSGPCGAENETRTRDPDLGKVVLYQLSYFRLSFDGAKVQLFSFSQAFFLHFFLLIIYLIDIQLYILYTANQYNYFK